MPSDLKKNRLVWADLIRVIAILMVVLVHTTALDTTREGLTLSTYLFVLAKNCIPLFVMISGALLIHKQEADVVFFKKRVKRILIPWAFWAGVYLFVFMLMGGVIQNNLTTEYLRIFSSKFTFLPLIFSLYLIIPILRQVFKKQQHYIGWYMVLLWFLGVSFLPYLRNTLAFPLSVDNGLVRQTVEFSGFLILGHLLSNIKVTENKAWKAATLFLGSYLATVWLVNIPTEQTLIFSAYISPTIILSSTALFLLLKKAGQNKSINNLKIPLTSLSKASFGVFLVHTLVIELIAKFAPISNQNLFAENVYRFLITTVFSFGLIMLLNQSKTLKNVVS